MDQALKGFIDAKTDDSVVHISDAIVRTGYTTPYKMGFKKLDDAFLGGVRAGDLIVITGLSGEGKTTLAQNISARMSGELSPSLWFSYEVILDNLYAKFKEIGAEDEDYLVYVPKRNTSGNVGWIKEKTKEALAKFGTKFVFIDHLDYLSPTNINNSDQYRMVLRNICQELKTMAIDLEVSVFLMAHVKKVQGREIEMQDISESSGIYQLADFVIAVKRKFEIKNEGGDKVRMYDNRGAASVLKARLTGSLVTMNYHVERNKIISYDDSIV